MPVRAIPALHPYTVAWKSGKGPVLLEFGSKCESSLSGTSVGVDTISGDLALRVLRNSLAGDPRSSLGVGSGWRSISALWTDAEWTSDGCQWWDDARCRHAPHSAPPEPNVACRDIENATPLLSLSLIHISEPTRH